MSIGIWAQVATCTHIGLYWIVGTCLYMGRAPRTKETLPGFRDRCQVTRHSRVFPQVDGLSTDTPILGRHIDTTS